MRDTKSQPKRVGLKPGILSTWVQCLNHSAMLPLYQQVCLMFSLFGTYLSKIHIIEIHDVPQKLHSPVFSEWCHFRFCSIMHRAFFWSCLLKVLLKDGSLFWKKFKISHVSSPWILEGITKVLKNMHGDHIPSNSKTYWRTAKDNDCFDALSEGVALPLKGGSGMCHGHDPLFSGHSVLHSLPI